MWASLHRRGYQGYIKCSLNYYFYSENIRLNLYRRHVLRVRFEGEKYDLCLFRLRYNTIAIIILNALLQSHECGN